MKCAQLTQTLADALRVAVDAALGYPVRGTVVGRGVIAAQIAGTWNGIGACPPGWTATKDDEYVASASDVLYPLTDADVSAVQANSGKITGPELAAVNAAAAGRVDVSDLTTGRTVNKKVL